MSSAKRSALIKSQSSGKPEAFMNEQPAAPKGMKPAKVSKPAKAKKSKKKK